MPGPRILHSLGVNTGDAALGKFGEMGGGWSEEAYRAGRNERGCGDPCAWEAGPRGVTPKV